MTLEPLEHTEEDCLAWLSVSMRCHRLPTLYTRSLMADRRDAEVMHQLATFDHWERDYTQDRTRRWATAQRLVARQL